MADAVIGALRVVLGADSAAFEKQMNDLGNKLQSIGTKIAGIGAGLTAGITLPLVALGKKAFGAFEESEKAIAKLDAALKSTGGTVGFTSEQLQGMAAQLQQISTFDDDDILGNVTANLLRFGEISGSTFKDAQLAVLNVATAMKTDLASAATLVGKALNDPAKAFGALRKAGILFSEAQKKIIEQLVKTGRVAEAQKEIIKGFTEAFGGQAAALAATAEGKWTQAMNAISDAMEDIGKVIAPFVVKVAESIKSLAEAFHALDPSVQQFIVYSLAAAAALGPLLIGLGAVVAAVGAIGAPVIAAGAALAAFLYLMFGSDATFDDFKTKGTGAFGSIDSAIDNTKNKFEDWKKSWTDWKLPAFLTADAGVFPADFVERSKAEFNAVMAAIELFVANGTKYFTVLGLEIEALGVRIQLWVSQVKGYWALIPLYAEIMVVQAQLAFVKFTLMLLEAAKAIEQFAINIRDTAFDTVQAKFEALGTTISTKAGEIRNALVNAKSGFTELAAAGVAAMSRLASSAKQFLQDALGKAIDYVMKKISELIAKFKEMYDKVVGNSYIPDMVTESNAAMKDMSRTMLKMAEKAVDGTNALFANINSPSVAMGEVQATKTIIGEMADTGGQGSAQPVNNFYATVKIETPELAAFQAAKQQITNDLSDMFVGARLRPA